MTFALIVVNALIFYCEGRWGSSVSEETLYRMGGLVPDRAAAFRYATLVSYGYLHIGFVHIAVNMFSLHNIGRALEPILGSARFFVLYTLSLVGGGAAILLGSRGAVVAGASGALFGLLGAVVVLLVVRYRHTANDDERKAIRRQIAGLLVPNLVISLLPGVSLLGHAGGLVVGMLFVARSVRAHVEDPSDAAFARRERWLGVAAGLFAALTVVAIASVWVVTRPWLVAS